jgi:hypothetical protein
MKNKLTGCMTYQSVRLGCKSADQKYPLPFNIKGLERRKAIILPLSQPPTRRVAGGADKSRILGPRNGFNALNRCGDSSIAVVVVPMKDSFNEIRSLV